ncbi:hypothetical protein phytr_8350 [Candidatus Phycorickettsia trachydisci]|uniref:BON domain-containing protein n=1 Tax=Candidatus Phycorickettsia trachydisci TaxID=2115978 RepID=A0A2P1P932_9RICK|nr:BON domain-containing protein [Candidatus Phycorickettsia trachydisci]AVP87767.1 hypothetical protein phytr_8350 [Candidatus Phycorickettsia trachydisci]
MNFLIHIAIICLLSSCSVFVPTSVVKLGMSAAKDKTIGESIDDTAIETKIKKEFLVKDFKHKFARINVEVVKSKVLLTGVVESEEDIVSAVEVAWAQKGVKAVANELQVDENSKSFDPKQYAIDTWITTRVKSKLFFARDIKFVNYTVVTTRNVVYIIGVARSEDELTRVTDIAARIQGVEKVVSHVKVGS